MQASWDVSADLSAALTGYAERFHAGVPSGHHVASPLGAWLLAALCAPAATGAAGQDLGNALDVDPHAATAPATRRGRDGAGPWHGLPVFSAWVESADEVA
jgi:hypothetical protein